MLPLFPTRHSVTTAGAAGRVFFLSLASNPNGTDRPPRRPDWRDDMTRDQMASIAIRHDTVMSRAMLRALGIPAPKRPRRRRRG